MFQISNRSNFKGGYESLQNFVVENLEFHLNAAVFCFNVEIIRQKFIQIHSDLTQ